MDIQYGNLSTLSWLWLVVVAAALLVGSALLRTRMALKFATANLVDRIMPPSQVVGRLTAGGCLIGTMALLVIALVDIRWGKVPREVPQAGIEIVFLLDVSRSMLAEDATPSRLERAKQQIKDIVDELGGDRIALVLFAGAVRQHVPLTSHYEDFKQTLDLVGPHHVVRGGSRLGDAIKVAQQSFMEQTLDHKAIVIFTDGEDHESRPIEAAREAHAELGIRIFTVGLGDFDQGARIPVNARSESSFLQHDGETVWSKLNGKILKQIAAESDGAYIPAGTKQVNMADVYHGYIEKIEKRDFETAKIDGYEARYQWFLAPAIVLLLIEILLGTARPEQPASSDGNTGPSGSNRTAPSA